MSFSIWLHKTVRDPVSGLTHLFGAGLGCIGLFYLLMKTIPTNDPRLVTSAAVFGTSLILLYLSSATYHLLHVSDETRLILRRIDHSFIFTLIAGSYTPYCLVTLRHTWGTKLLILIWCIALLGLGLSIFWIHAPRWLTTALYLVMGWLIVFVFSTLKENVSAEILYWLVAGGLSYSLGAIVYAIKRPNPFPPIFGFHEIWHLMVLLGSFCHYISVVYVLT